MTIGDITLQRGGTPLYRQIADALAEQVQNRVLAPGTRLPTQRALAEQLAVTVGTITRAYAEAERRGIVMARVGAGTYVCQADRPSWTFTAPQHQGSANFGYNVPPGIDRANVVEQALQTLSRHRTELNQLLLYNPPEGIPQHREILARWLNAQGVAVTADKMLFTSGAQHGVQLTLQALCRPGDTLLVERLTYPGLISLARQQGLVLKPVDMDEQGLVPEALAAACRQYRPRLLYTTPTLQNPTTAIMGEQRRRAVLAVCEQQDLLVVEDDVHGLLPADRPPPLFNLAPEQVVHIGGLGKALAPGLRVGYLQAPAALYPGLVGALQNHCWMISPLLTALAAILIENGAADTMLDDIRRQMMQRWQRLGEHVDMRRVQFHPQGFHGWLSLPEYWSLSEFLIACRAQGLEVKSSELFTPPGYSAPPWVRIAASAPANLEQLTAGAEQLAKLLYQRPDARFTL